jgi:uncharacterized protein YndB with AHSA1/START domain
MARTDTASRVIEAAPSRIYRAHLEADAVARWRAPSGMRGRVLAFEPWEGGVYRMVLEYEDAAIAGKTEANADVFEGEFVELAPNERIVELIRFQSDDPAFARPMRMTTSLEPFDGGTRVTIVAEDVPEPITAEDHAAGMASALANLATYVE